MNNPSKAKAFVAAFLIAAAMSVLIHLYHERQIVPALERFKASGKVDGSTFAAFGYKGWITVMGGGEMVNFDVNNGTSTPVNFSQSYIAQMFGNWNCVAWLGCGMAFVITGALALRTPCGKRVVFICGWFQVVFGTIILSGAFVLRGYFGLDGFGKSDSIQITNLIAGPGIALLGFWLTRESNTREVSL